MAEPELPGVLESVRVEVAVGVPVPLGEAVPTTPLRLMEEVEVVVPVFVGAGEVLRVGRLEGVEVGVAV